MNLTSYKKTLPFGIYFYVLYHLVYALRFNRLNTEINYLDIFILLVGFLSVYLLVFFAKKLPGKRNKLLIPFALSIPLAYIGSLGGGLLGPVGILVFGTLPFAIFLFLGYFLIYKKSG